MNNASQETTATETKQLDLLDDNISQADYERLRSGEKVEVEVKKSESVAIDAADEIEDEDSEASQTDGDDSSDEIELSANDKKPKRGFKKRIDKLNAKLSEAQAQAEHWRREALRVKPEEKQPEEIQVVPAAKSEPNPDDYETSTEFYRAHARWAAQEEIRAVKETERQEKMRLEAESKKTSFQSKVQDFQKAHDDFDDVIADVDDIMMSPAISQAILESDNGPELMYELAKNKKEYERICSLPPFESVRALGRFEAKYLSQPSEEKTVSKTITTTKAPPPPKPISSSSANGRKSIWDDNISQAEYERMRSEQEKRRATNY